MGGTERGREKQRNRRERRGGREKREASLLCSASESITAEAISAEILSKATCDRSQAGAGSVVSYFVFVFSNDHFRDRKKLEKIMIDSCVFVGQKK